MPSFSKPFKCKSIGLVPMSQPPGYENIACLNLPNIAPASITDDLIFLISSFGISCDFIFLESIIIFPFFFVTVHPSNFSISRVVFVS